MPSDPVDLLGFTLRIKDKISSSFIEIDSILLLVIYSKTGMELLFKISLHSFEKCSLKSFALSMQFKINVPSLRIGGIFGALHLFITLSIIFQYFLLVVPGSFSLDPKFARYDNLADSTAS